MSEKDETCFICKQKKEKVHEFSLIDDWLVFKIPVCDECMENVDYHIFECSMTAECLACGTKLCGICGKTGHTSLQCEEL